MTDLVIKDDTKADKHETYYVFTGLSPAGIEKTIAKFRERVLECWGRRNCSSFAMTTARHRKSGYIVFPAPSSGFEVTVTYVRLSNSFGKRLRLMFVEPNNPYSVLYENEALTAMKCTRDGGIRKFYRMHEKDLHVHPNFFFDHFYAFVHMKLAGYCLKGSTKDQATLDRLDKLEVSVEVMQEALKLGPPPENLSAPESSPKRQKTSVEEPIPLDNQKW